MVDWQAAGFDARTADKLGTLGIRDAPALAAWVQAHPYGTEAVGRVMMTEFRQYLDTLPGGA